MIRLYGISRHNGSWGRVTAGIARALESLDLLAGFVPLDDLDPEDQIPGATAPVGLLVGPTTLAPALVTHGAHEKRYAILAPNSSWLPEDAVQKLLPYAEPVAPSSWGADVLAKYVGHRTEPYRHGVDERWFVHDVERRLFMEEIADSETDNSWSIVHFASTHRERKGTRELTMAWRMLMCDLTLAEQRQCTLTIVVDSPPTYFGPETNGIRFVRPVNLSAMRMSAYYQIYHAVVQPSRGEGFGMTPLEALCCGVPIVATACTGHADYLVPIPPGAVIVSHGSEEPIDDGPGAVAPGLDANDLQLALQTAYEMRHQLTADAIKNSDALRSRWSWTAQTKDWLRRMGMS